MNKKVTLLFSVMAAVLASGIAVAQKLPGTGETFASGAPRTGNNPDGTPTLTVSIPINGAQTFQTCNFAAVTPGNVTITANLGPNAVITGLGGGGTIRTLPANGTSFVSEAAIQFRGAVQPGEVIRFRPLPTSTAPNPTGAPFNVAPIDLSAAGLPNITLGASGVLTLEFCETFDDNATGPDAEFVAPSSIQVQCFNCVDPFIVPQVSVPTLSTWSILALLLSLGLVGGIAVRRFS